MYNWRILLGGFASASILTVGVFTNRRLLVAGGIGLALVSCISYVPILQHVFGTTGLTLTDWLIVSSFGVALLAADELRKALVRWRRPPSEPSGEVVHPDRRGRP